MYENLFVLIHHKSLKDIRKRIAPFIVLYVADSLKARKNFFSEGRLGGGAA